MITREGKAKFSIITPVYRESAIIDEYFGMIEHLEHSHLAEIIVVDGDCGSSVSGIDRSIHKFRLITAAPCRGGQLATGAGHANSDFLVFVHADTKLPRRALGLIENALGKYRAGAFELSIDSEDPAIRAIAHVANFRNRFTQTPYGDQVHFFRRSFYDRIGGYRDLPLMEDVDIMRRIKRRGEKIIILRDRVITDDRRWRKEGVVTRTLRNWTNLSLYRFGAPPERLMRRYQPTSNE